MKARDRGYLKEWVGDMVARASNAGIAPREEEARRVGPEVRKAVENSLRAIELLESRIRGRMEGASEGGKEEAGRLLQHISRLREALAIPMEGPDALVKVQAAAQVAEHVARQLGGERE